MGTSMIRGVDVFCFFTAFSLIISFLYRQFWIIFLGRCRINNCSDFSEHDDFILKVCVPAECTLITQRLIRCDTVTIVRTNDWFPRSFLLRVIKMQFIYKVGWAWLLLELLSEIQCFSVFLIQYQDRLNYRCINCCRLYDQTHDDLWLNTLSWLYYAKLKASHYGDICVLKHISL